MEVQGKVFVVTGGGNGIGREVVHALLDHGALVAAVDRSEAALRETADGAAAGTALSCHVVDITDQTQVDGLVDHVVAEHGTVDGVINVAGIVHRFVPVAELRVDEVEKVMAVNYWGTLRVSLAFLPVLVERERAALVNVSSMGGLIPVPGQGAYGASKAAVKSLTETLYVELAATPVTVTLVIPGAVATGILDNSGVGLPDVPAAAPETDARAEPAVLPVQPAEAARAVVDAIRSEQFRVFVGSDAERADASMRSDPDAVLSAQAEQLRAASRA